MPGSWINRSTFNFTLILNSACRYDSCKYSETVGSIMRQEGVERDKEPKKDPIFQPINQTHNSH